MNIQTYKWDEVLDAGDMRVIIDEYITERMDMIVSDIKEKAAGMALAAIGETAANG